MRGLKSLLFTVSLLTSLLASAQISFFEGTWEDALKQAQKKNKVIFVDAFTDWCGPCKMMSAQTFTNTEVGTFFNDNFINVKLDMEKGEGPSFAKTYQVNAYPTLLFINPGSKEIVHKVLGFRNSDLFLNEAKTAVTKFGGNAEGGKKKKEKKQKKCRKSKITTETGSVEY